MLSARLVACLLLLPAAVVSCSGGDDASSSPPTTLTIFAAASTTDALTELAALYEQQHGIRVTCTFDGSSVLARQILAGAPADVFLSANPAWMDELEHAGATQPGSRQNLLANRLVVIIPADQPASIRLERSVPITEGLPGVQRLAMGDPSHVPAGQYARDALQWLGWWEDAAPMVLPALDVRSALRLVEIGEADAGIVYATDAASSDRVAVAGELPEESHQPIRYPVAVCTDADAAAAEFVGFLHSLEAREILRRHGFIPAAVASPAS